MTDRLRGRRALVTGASRGIGAGIAARLASEGADVAIVARTLDHHPTLPGSLNETAARLRTSGGEVAVITADLTDPADRARIIPEAVTELGGPVDILVNNAAAAIYAPASEMPLRRRMVTFEVNVHAPLDLAQAVIPAMRERGEGWIVNVSSRSALPAPGPPFVMDGLASVIGIYGASKAALNRLSNTLAHDLWSSGIRVNTVEPRAAVMSEGAEVLAGEFLRDDQKESMEQMVEAVLALCDCAPDRTGASYESLELLTDWGITVMTLDGMTPWPAGARR